MSTTDGPIPLMGATPEHNGGVFRLSTGDEVLLPPREELYTELTLRNRGLISMDEQQMLRRSTLLIAGCGAVGGATIEPLLRAGAEHFILCEPGTYDYNNANRQNMRIQDVGKNKASAFAEKMPDINPFAQFEVHTDGITLDNVADVVGRSDLIIDGVDVTEPPALQAKFALHREAKRLGKPVIGGYDIAGTQWTPTYDYRDPNVKLFDGRLTEADLAGLTPMGFLSKVISPLKIPIEMIPEIERQLRGQAAYMPQLGYTALLFGVLVVRLGIDVLMERDVRDSILIDVPNEVRTTKQRMSTTGRRLGMLFLANNRMRQLKRAGRLGVYLPEDDEVFAGMQEVLVREEWIPDEAIIRQGEPGDAFFVIEEGEVIVERTAADGKSTELARLGPGEYFGEMALLNNDPRNATVTAAVFTVTRKLTNDHFARFLRSSAAGRKQIGRVAEEREA